jgi:hypothetical protein
MYQNNIHPPLKKEDIIFGISISKMHIQILAEIANLNTLFYN